MKAVILAGGLGTRLKPFTEVIPKPLLPIGEKAIIEIQIEHLKRDGFDEIYIATNYKSKYVESYVGDGSNFGVKINFSLEKKRLGTTGPLSLLKDKLTEPFLVMNGDILTKANFKEIYNFHIEHKDSKLTVVTKEIVTPFRFGSVETKGDYLLNVEEKPDLKIEIVAGIYIMKPEIFEYIPYNEKYDMNQLIQDMIKNDDKITRYFLNDYWLDIGKYDDYNQARNDFDKFLE
jgi:NDP-sugar pyrophosphorylase family protein